jgi:ABC-2 type transport system permease protein
LVIFGFPVYMTNPTLSNSAAVSEWQEINPVLGFFKEAAAVAEAEIRKLRHDSFEVLARVIQPAVWLVIFGRVFSHLREIPTGGIPYLDFIAPGILAQSVLFGAVFYGVSVIWEKDLGILHKLLATPASRLALVFGKALAASARSMPQAGTLYVLALFMGVHLWFNPFTILATVVVICITASLFATLSLIIACIGKTRQRFMGINQVLLMPLFLGSNAIYPLQMMPSWLRLLSLLNPLTYAVDALRALMLRQAHSVFGLGTDLLVLTFSLAVLLAIGTYLYPRVIQ